MRKLNRKRYLAALISAIMLLALLPITSLAASADYGDFLVTGDDLSGVSFENDTLTISTSGTYTVAMAQKGNVTDQHITVASGVTAALVLDGVSVSSGTTALEISGADVTLILSSGSDNSFVSKGAACSAIHAPSGSTLTIRCDSSDADHVCNENCGSLTAQYDSNTGGPAAIGGNTAEDTGSISIQGGVINASNIYGAAIGGGGGRFYSGNGGAATVSISGGIVTATSFDAAIGGGEGADGIGGGGGTPGQGGSGGSADISITGGVVNTQGASIGGGNGGNGGYNYHGSNPAEGGAGGDAEITLTGGVVNTGSIGAGEPGAGGGGTPSGSAGTAGTGLIETGTDGSCFVIADRLITSSDEDDFTGAFVIAGNGRVYSNMSLYTDVTLPDGATLTIPDNVVLTIPTDVTFANNSSDEQK